MIKTQKTNPRLRIHLLWNLQTDIRRTDKIIWCLQSTILNENAIQFKPVKLRLKIDLVSYPARAEGLLNRIKDGNECIYAALPPTAGYDTRSIFWWSKAGLNLDVSFSLNGFKTKDKAPSLHDTLPIVGREQKGSSLSKGHECERKRKHSHLIFELGLLIPFPLTITVTQISPPCTYKLSNINRIEYN